ncbi:MAG: LPS-assembly protein LptD [Methylococcales bacterium]|nr:LPS-assembly protein LptD [Methylococcales bacterium]
MRRRLSLVFLPLLYAPISFANDAAWDCEQSKDTKEWLCVGDTKPTATTDESEPPRATAPASTQRTRPSAPAAQAITPSTLRRATTPVAEDEEPIAPPVATQRTTPPVAAPIVHQDVRPTPPVTTQATQPVVPEESTPVAPAVASQEPETPPTEKSESHQSSSLPIRLPTSPTTKPTSSATNTANKQSGWNCDADNQDDTWNCNLVGTDPKGEAHPVKVLANNHTTDDSWHLLDPAFSNQQEQNFDTLVSKLQYDPWENCGVPQKTQPAFVPKKGLRDTSPLALTSDFGEIFDNEIGSYLGNVEINRADQHSLSHVANYDSVSETLDLNGDVFYNEEELALYGHSASIKLASDKSKIRDAQFISPASHFRGSSKVVYRDSKTFSRYKDAAYTSCRPGNQDWVLHASQLKLNDVEGKGAVKDAWIEFKGVPVFYTPYLSFPTDNRRTTGFLTPSLHYTQQGGVGLYTPYYWNIAPNYDATFTPRYLTSRGLLLGGNFRYLEEMTKGGVKFEYLPNDQQLHKARYLGAITNHTVYTPQITSNLDLHYVSDKNYFSELGNALAIPNFSYLRSVADVSYVREGIALTAMADNYQSVDSAFTVRPYRRLPQINLNLSHSFKTMVPIDVATASESVYFQHGTQVNGQRLNVKPSITIPFQTASAFVTPKLSLQHTEYFLSKQSIGTIGNISRTLPIASIDSGLFFEKDLNLGGSSMLHTLEPRLFYLYVPYKNQNNIPLFDTAQYDFVFNSLFRENRFAGTDRIQDANQLSMAVTSRLVDSTTGQEKLKLTIGDILYFKNRNVMLNQFLYPVETSFSSPIIAEFSSHLTDHISVDTGLQWDPSVKDTTLGNYSSDITRGKAALHFINEPNEIINAGYYYRKNPQVLNRLDDIIQTDVSAHWPIYDDWSVVGRWQYSLLYNQTQEGFLGLEKENCCWRFRVIGRHYLSSLVNNTGFINAGTNQLQGQAQTGVFFQIELKGLTGIGERLDTFFEQNIYGYRRSDQ